MDAIAGATAMRVVQTFVAGVVIWGLIGSVGLFALSRRRRRTPAPAVSIDLVFVVPALNESRVIAATVRHLLEFDPRAVVVVDDGSDDGTSDQVRSVDDSRVLLLRRRLPDARRGKGRALNAAFRFIRSNPGLAAIDPSSLVLCVVDADGRLQRGAPAEAAVALADPAVGACQVSVRIRNRSASFWTRMQHFEFVAFTALYQRGRERTGAVGLGGNGQFARLSALSSLGDRPWSDCLVEDMDLGIRLLLNGWRIRYIPSSYVSQQGVGDVRSLLRQRTRWYQGTLQCLRHVPVILGSKELPVRTRMDLAGVLIAPALVLAVSPLILGAWIWAIVVISTGQSAALTGHGLLVSYLLAFLPALLLSYTFWIDEPDTTLPEALLAGHLFVVYGYMWFVAGWRAVARVALRRRGWTKTAREIEAPLPTLAQVAA